MTSENCYSLGVFSIYYIEMVILNTAAAAAVPLQLPRKSKSKKEALLLSGVRWFLVHYVMIMVQQYTVLYAFFLFSMVGNTTSCSVHNCYCNSSSIIIIVIYILVLITEFTV